MKTIKLNNKDVPCEDVLRIRLVVICGQLHSEFTYRCFEPTYHEETVLVPRDKAYPLEIAVRRAKR